MTGNTQHPNTRAVEVLKRILGGETPTRKELLAAYADVADPNKMGSRRGKIPTTRQLQILKLLGDGIRAMAQPPRQIDIARGLHVSAATVSGHLDRLEKMGLVERIMPGEFGAGRWQPTEDGWGYHKMLAPVLINTNADPTLDGSSKP